MALGARRADGPGVEGALVVVRAPAKLNLTLDIVGRRADGYHLLESVMQSIDLYDYVMLSPVSSGFPEATRGSRAYASVVQLTGNGVSAEGVPLDESNLATRAVQRLRDAVVSGRERGRYDSGQQAPALAPLAISIEKHIPVAAGLAGGSANAAAALVGANELWQLGLTEEQLARVGADLGADVPFCVTGGTAVARGVGEQLERIDGVPAIAVVVATPDLRVSTADVYARYDEWTGRHDSASDTARLRTEAMAAALRRGDVPEAARLLYNALEPVTARLHPEVGQLREAMLAAGAVGAAMCGSGPSVFGLAHDDEHARAIAARLERPGLFVAVCRFVGAGGRILEKERRA